MTTSDAVTLSAGLAEVLGVPQRSDRATVAEALARIAGLASPRAPETWDVFVAIVESVQRNIIDEPEVPMDRAIVASTALTHGCVAAGPDATRVLFDELGDDALDTAVRQAIYTSVTSGLVERNLIRIVGP
jgi:hypothetical protein